MADQMCEEVSEAVVGGHSCQAGGLSLAPSSMGDEDAGSEGRPLHTLTPVTPPPPAPLELQLQQSSHWGKGGRRRQQRGQGGGW